LVNALHLVDEMRAKAARENIPVAGDRSLLKLN
jgi:hypothetical protein